MVAGQGEGLLHEGGPFGLIGLSEQVRSGLLRGLSPFSPVTLLAGADHILPCGSTASGPGYNMVQIQLIARQLSTAILAGTFVSGIDIIATEPDLPLWHPVITHQKDNSGDAYHPVDQSDRFITHRNRQIAPAIKIKSLVLFVHCARNPLIEKGEGTPYGGNMDWEVGAIENKDLGVQD